MKFNAKNILRGFFKWTAITIAFILLLLFLIPIIFPGKIESEVKKLANQRLSGELDFKNTKLSFFTHFPSLTVSLDDISLMGSAPYANDTLLKADQIAFGINLKRLIFDKEVKVDELYISRGDIHVMVNQKGQANYNVYISPDTRENKPKDPAEPEEGTAIQLDRVDIRDCHLLYNDHSAKILVDAHGFNYLGKGGLAKNIFDLETNADIDSLDFYYDRFPYLEKKEVHADLITRVNTNALSFILEKNELRVNRLPVEFTGSFTIFRDGYNIDIDANSKNTRLKDVFSALPPPYLTWMEDTRIRGRADLLFTFKGRYNAGKNLKPTLGFDLKVRNGFVRNRKAPVPLEDFQVDMSAKMPSLDMAKLLVNIRKLDFKVGEKGFFKARVNSSGTDNIKVAANIKSALDLAELDRAIGIQNLDLKGTFKADIVSNGVYNAANKLFPKTNGNLTLKDGWLKTSYYPNPIKDITFVANVTNNTGTYNDLKVSVTPASFVFEGNPVYVNATVSDFTDMFYKARIKGELDLGRIYRVFSQKGLDITGYAKADLNLNGRQSYATTGQYDKLDNRGTILFRNIKTTSELFPKPFLINQGLFRFENEKMWFDKFNAHYGKSDFALGGYLLNTINYFLESHGTLHGDFTLNSNLINVDEFMALEKGANDDQKTTIVYAKEENPKASGVVVLPTNLDVWLNANAKKVEYNGLVLNNLKGKTGISKGQLYLQNASFDIIDCVVGLDARYDDESPVTANFDAHFTAKDFSVKRAYNEIPMFHDMVTAAEKAEGIISLDYKIKGDLNANMGPIYESLEGGGTVTLRDVKVSGFKMFGSISEKTGQGALNDPRMKDIVVKTTIDNNLIRIDDFAFKVSLFRPNIRGTTSFDGLLDLRIRLGLPPAGLIGIPITVTGTHEDPKIKIFSKTGQKIDDAVYDEKNNQVIKEEKRETPKEKEAREKKEGKS